MSFCSNSFIFNRISSEQFGLELYDISGKENGSTQFPSVNIIQDKIPTRYGSLHYGIDYNENLKFNLVFGVSSSTERIDPFDTAVLTSWLMGHSTPKWLELCQLDMSWVRFKCTITSIEKVVVSGYTVAFSCAVECDSPFAYSYPKTETIQVSGTTNYTFKNISSYNGFLYPSIKITPALATSEITIKNKSDNDRCFFLSEIKSPSIITADGNSLILSDDLGTNLYQSFNNNFLRFVRGDNHLEITGDCVLKIITQFPINIGGITI